MTITGENFLGPVEVFFGQNAAASVTVIDPQRVQAVSPSSSQAGPVDVTVRTANGEATLQGGFRYLPVVLPLPEIHAVEPGFGPLAGGNAVTVTGENFQEQTRVFFGSTESPAVTFIEVHTIEATVPPGEDVGPVPVTVETEVGSFTAPDAYRYVLPVITAVQPDRGPVTGGTEVVLSGRYFTTVQDTQLRFGPASAQVLAVQETSLQAVTPPAPAPGAVTITLTNAFGTVTLQDAFSYEAVAEVPTVEAISPQVGPASGGTTVVVTGSGFSGTSLSATLCGVPLKYVRVIDDATFQAVTPAGAAGRSCDLTVTTAGGSVTLPEAFLYQCDWPRVQILFPPPGRTTASQILLEGTATDQDGVAEVTVNGTPAESTDGFAHFSFTAELEPGENIFTIGVRDTAGCSQGEAAVVRVIGQAGVLPRSPIALTFTDEGTLIVGDFAHQALLAVDLSTGHTQLLRYLRLYEVDFHAPDSLQLCYQGLLRELSLTSGMLRDIGRSDFALFRSVVRLGASTIVACSERPAGLYLFGEEESRWLSTADRGGGPPFTAPVSVARLPDGTLIVSDRGAASLFRVDPQSGDRELLSGPDRGSGPLLVQPGPVVVLNDSAAVVADSGSENFLVQIDLHTGAREVISSPSRGAGPTPALREGARLFPPFDMEVAPDGRVAVADPVTAGVFFIDPESGDRQLVFAGNAGGGLKFLKPQAMCAGQRGLYVVSRSPYAVYHASGENGNRSLVTGAGRGQGPLPQSAGGIAAAGGTLYLADPEGAAVFAADSETGTRRVIADSATGSGLGLVEPTALVAVGSTLYVADAGLQAVVAIETETLARSVVSGAGRGSGPPPGAVDIVAAGEDLVVLREDGGLIGVDTATGDREELVRVNGITGQSTGVARFGDTALLVVTTSAVFQFTGNDGLQMLTGPGKGDGPGLISAQAVASDSAGRIYVLDAGYRGILQVQAQTGDRVLFSR